ncbi:MAG: CPBP family intramembrane metalloprotease [Rhodospirillaceae bacterium]|nr:CPBP family intramembrane metalloprotease [Rhodospirillaceae bacterium]
MMAKRSSSSKPQACSADPVEEGAVMLSNIKLTTWPLIASIGAVAISPLLMLVTGRDEPYTFWISALMIGLWAVQRLTRAEVGFVAGDGKSYLIGLAYVVGIIGIVAIGAWAAQLIDLKDYSARTVFRRISLNFIVTFILALITEEGFFRGALWASCVRAGFSPVKTILWTSIAFGLWHFAVPILDPDFTQPLSKVPQYVIGSTVFGVAMGLLRLTSKSIVMPSACHALWNATDYTFFGTGEKVGQLGITDTSIWDPERGYAGLILAILAAGLLWRWVKPRRAAEH